MTSTKSSQTVLVTGATGFVAGHVVRVFLEAGYSVRGTVRSADSIPSVLDKHPEKYRSRLSCVVVPDIATTNALHEAANGVTGIVHVASPFSMSVTDNEKELLKPAIQGALNALEAAAANSSTVRKVVLTSSMAAILDLAKGLRPGYTYNEKDWNPVTYEQAKDSDNGSFAYCASKALAEKAAWDWPSSHPDSKFALAAIVPPWIIGPTVDGHIKSLKHLNVSTEVVWRLINGSTKEVPPTDFAGFADVRDVARAHLLAFEKEEANGKRFLVGTHFDYQTACDILREKIPELRATVPEGKKGYGEIEPVYEVDGSRATEVLGLEYTPLEKSLVDTAEELMEADKKEKK